MDNQYGLSDITYGNTNVFGNTNVINITGQSVTNQNQIWWIPNDNSVNVNEPSLIYGSNFDIKEILKAYMKQAIQQSMDPGDIRKMLDEIITEEVVDS